MPLLFPVGTVPKWHSKFRFQNGILSNVSVSDLLYLLYLYKYEAISQVACPPNAALSGFQLEVGRYQAFGKNKSMTSPASKWSKSCFNFAKPRRQQHNWMNATSFQLFKSCFDNLQQHSRNSFLQNVEALLICNCSKSEPFIATD